MFTQEGAFHTCGNGLLITKSLNIYQTLYDVNLHIDIESKMEKCKSEDGICFKDGFELFRYNGEGEPKVPYNANNPDSKAEKLKAREFLHNNFLLLGKITGNSTSEERVNNTLTLNIKEFRGMTFGIKSRGGCGSVIRMRFYYYVCKSTFINSVIFVKTLAPQNGTKAVFGNCSANAGLISRTGSLKAFCNSNGSWTAKEKMLCRCDKGYESTDHGCLGMF